MIDVAAIGELLIDFTPGDGEWSFVAHPGGSVANFLAQLSVLGKSTAFMGMVGQDQFGAYLRDTLVGVGVGTEGLKMNPLSLIHILGAVRPLSTSFWEATQMSSVSGLKYSPFGP